MRARSGSQHGAFVQSDDPSVFDRNPPASLLIYLWGFYSITVTNTQPQFQRFVDFFPAAYPDDVRTGIYHLFDLQDAQSIFTTTATNWPPDNPGNPQQGRDLDLLAQLQTALAGLPRGAQVGFMTMPGVVLSNVGGPYPLDVLGLGQNPRTDISVLGDPAFYGWFKPDEALSWLVALAVPVPEYVFARRLQFLQTGTFLPPQDQLDALGDSAGIGTYLVGYFDPVEVYASGSDLRAWWPRLLAALPPLPEARGRQIISWDLWLGNAFPGEGPPGDFDTYEQADLDWLDANQVNWWTAQEPADPTDPGATEAWAVAIARVRKGSKWQINTDVRLKKGLRWINGRYFRAPGMQ